MTFWLVEVYYVIDGSTDARWGPWVVIDPEERGAIDRVMEEHIPAGGLPMSSRLRARQLRFDARGVANAH